MDTTKQFQNHLTFQDSEQAFTNAIRTGRLSTNPQASNYAGLFMYMGTRSSDDKDLFKNSNTRQYID